MATTRFSMLKSLSSYISPSVKQTATSLQSYNPYLKLTRFANQSHVKLSYPLVNSNYHKSQLHSALNSENIQPRILGFSSDTRCYKTNRVSVFSPTLTKLYSETLYSHSSIAFGSIPFLNHRSYSSFFGGKGDKSTRDMDVPATTSGSEVDVNNSDIVEGDSIDKIKDAWQSIVDGVNYTGEKVKVAYDELTPYVQQMLDLHPYLRDVVVPIGGYLIGSILAWVVMPRILRRFHKYAIQGPAALLHGGLFGDQVPYEKSFWGALEDPIRYLITFMAFVQIGMMVAPTTIASQYLAQAWRGAVILSFVWFLHRWKTNVFTRALTFQSLAGIDREKMLTLDKLSSVGLFVIGVMALAEACGVAVQSILTVGGIGGVATAFASRDILGNVLSGLSMQFSKPFSLGDTIKVSKTLPHH
ncbi:mechanosensitive ion channel protein 1, mitochondrial-like [Pistacia vera]|uniref:mechanosensitive ion channel protein 1, mitochondrial-like n=1 Tax=Pistacia vera TaxID=55513 RepID=UPI001263CB7A|nr:mechanosensitive ion channel protein 1, mitochondrial-like [Pistacia vera]